LNTNPMLNSKATEGNKMCLTGLTSSDKNCLLAFSGFDTSKA
jgi:hypothetical protein